MSTNGTLSDFEGPLEEVAAHVQKLIEKHGEDARLSWIFGNGLVRPKIEIFQPWRPTSLDEVKKMFPRKAGTCGVTGYIPMDFVNANLPALAKIVKDNNLRRIYRGPRHYIHSATTRREDAHSMVLYRK